MTYRSRVRWPSSIPLVVPLVLALAVRLAAWWTLPYEGQISDEPEYLAAAAWLAEGRGFSFFKDWIWTRPPLYILFLAAHISLFGPANLVPIRVSQMVLSVATVALAMAWGAMLAAPDMRRRVAVLVGWAMALGYGFATYAFLLLSETLFLFLLLLGLLLLTLWAARPRLAPLPLQGRGRGWGPILLLLAGGVALGLCALTRALLAGALPFFAVWVWWQGAGNRSFWRGVGHAALFTMAVSGIILPWSFYNTRLFGNNGLILIDTTGGYNAMLGAQAAHLEREAREACLAMTGGRGTPGDGVCPAAQSRDDTALYETLSQVPNHAERQQVAYATAWRWIRENPAGFARKTGREFLDLLTISYGGAERLRRGHTQGLVPIPHLLGLLLDDTLYYVAAPLAFVGFWRAQRRPGKGLAMAWLGFNLLTGPLFFAINRFRLPLLPILFIYAACAVAQSGQRWPSRGRRWVALAGAATLLLGLLPSFAYWGAINAQGDTSVLRNTFLGFQSRVVAWDCERAEAAIKQGDRVAAQRYVDRGSAQRISGNNGLDCFALLQASLDERRGEYRKALDLLQSMKPLPERYLLEGKIYRRIGEQERAVGAFVARDLELANPTTWAWEHLDPPANRRIDLGSGVDWGYIDGFYTREGAAEAPGNFRWSSDHARLRFVGAGAGIPQVLRLHVASPRPEAEAPARMTIRTAPAGSGCRRDQGTCASVVIEAIGAEWRIVEVPISATTEGEDVIVELESTIFVPGAQDLRSNLGAREQLRLLGVQIDWAELIDSNG